MPIITNFPIPILDNSIETKHISKNKLSANVIKLNSNYFSILADGTLSLSNNVSNIITEENKQKLNSIIINGDGEKFLSNDGVYKNIEKIKVYHNFDEFESEDLLSVFNNMNVQSILISEINNNNNYPYHTGKLTVHKLNNNSAIISFIGLNQIIYTKVINNNEISDWKSIEEDTFYINKTLTFKDWTSTNITLDNLEVGNYILKLQINMDIYIGILSWGEVSEPSEIILNHSGKADINEYIYLRLYNNSVTELQITSNKLYENTLCMFTFKRII